MTIKCLARESDVLTKTLGNSFRLQTTSRLFSLKSVRCSTPQTILHFVFSRGAKIIKNVVLAYHCPCWQPCGTSVRLRGSVSGLWVQASGASRRKQMVLWLAHLYSFVPNFFKNQRFTSSLLFPKTSPYKWWTYVSPFSNTLFWNVATGLHKEPLRLNFTDLHLSKF